MTRQAHRQIPTKSVRANLETYSEAITGGAYYRVRLVTTMLVLTSIAIVNKVRGAPSPPFAE